MSGDSDPERHQRTVAELLAEYGGSANTAPRRRRRRREDDDHTAPQTIIQRVLSDSGTLLPIRDSESDHRPSSGLNPPTPPTDVPNDRPPAPATGPAMPPNDRPPAASTGPMTGVPNDRPPAASTGPAMPPPNRPSATPSGGGMTSMPPGTSSSPGWAPPRPTADLMTDGRPPVGSPLPQAAGAPLGARLARPHAEPHTEELPVIADVPDEARDEVASTQAHPAGFAGDDYADDGEYRDGAPDAQTRLNYQGPATSINQRLAGANGLDDEAGDEDDFDEDRSHPLTDDEPTPLSSDDEEVDEEPVSPAREWLVIAAQVGVGAVAGAAVWLGFSWLWGFLPAAALAAAVAVIVGLVLIVRRLRRADDLQTTVLAVLAGLVVTVSPAALLLLKR